MHQPTQDRNFAQAYGSPTGEAELVSVIMPAFNAEPYIEATLLSVRGQTWRALEILVVDDGSWDATLEIVERHAAQDPRIRILRQANQGVAAARNAGLAAARGRYVAPIDADDIWTPCKIEAQMRAVHAHHGTVGLVYSWFVTVDGQGRIRDYRSTAQAEGNVLAAMAERNIVGNGSSPLILREAALAVGGYDSTLRDRNAEGCEDYKLYFSVAERYPFVLIRDYLMAYRIHHSSMSSHAARMVRSRAIVTQEIRQRHPELSRQLRRGNARARRFLLTRKLRSGTWSECLLIARDMLVADPVYALRELASFAWHKTLGPLVFPHHPPPMWGQGKVFPGAAIPAGQAGDASGR